MSDPRAPTHWKLGSRLILLNRPVLMGILNVTPDSFSDGGKLGTPEDVERAALTMVNSGAEILDLGAESTRPGAVRVSAEEQLRRLLPAIRAIRRVAPTVAISVDTTLEIVAAAAHDAGVDAINDVSAGEESDDGTLRQAARRGMGVVLMHRRHPPGQDRYSDQHLSPPAYDDVVGDLRTYLRSRADRALELGVAPTGIAVDPGLGFGKSVDQNLELIARTRELASLGYPVVSALSRKSFVGRVSLNRDSDPIERLPGTLALSVAHWFAGATVFRIHDVAEHRAALNAVVTIPSRNDTTTA